jgi:sporulation-control protein spo0M
MSVRNVDKLGNKLRDNLTKEEYKAQVAELWESKIEFLPTLNMFDGLIDEAEFIVSLTDDELLDWFYSKVDVCSRFKTVSPHLSNLVMEMCRRNLIKEENYYEEEA